MPTTQTTVSTVSAQIPGVPGQSFEKTSARIPEISRITAASGHRSEQFDLMMEQAAIVQYADNGDERRARVYADHLRQRGAVHGYQQRDQHAQINRQPAEQRHRLDVHLARARVIDHPDAQRELPHGNGETHRSDQANGECHQAGIHESPRFMIRSASS